MLDNIIKNHLYNSWLKFKKYLYFTKKGYDMKTNKKRIRKRTEIQKIESEKNRKIIKSIENKMKKIHTTIEREKIKEPLWEWL